MFSQVVNGVVGVGGGGGVLQLVIGIFGNVVGGFIGSVGLFGMFGFFGMVQGGSLVLLQSFFGLGGLFGGLFGFKGGSN